MTTLSTEITREPKGLAALMPEWRALWGRSRTATPFQSPEWLLPWWDAFAPGELRSIAVRENGRLVALAPLYREIGRYGSRLLPLGISLSDYLDILLDPAHSGGAKAIADAIAGMDDVDVAEWCEAQPGADVLRLPAQDGWDVQRTIASPCPVATLPDRPENLRDIVSPSRWRHLRTARNRAARQGETVIVQGNVDNAGALLQELVRLHTASSSRRRGNVFHDPRVIAFHAAALPNLIKQGVARLYALSIDRQIAAIYYGFHHRERAYAYQCGYDPAFAFQSPGALLTAHAMEQAINEGAREFHFLRGNESYKYEWGARDRMNMCNRLLRRQQRRAHG